MHVDKYGQGVLTERGMDVSDEAIERARDLMFLKFSSQGFTYRKIARLFNTNHRNVGRRIERIPAHVRSYYEKHPLVELGRAASDDAA